jgi:putrescine transport system substrate-binding protein
MPRLGCRGGDRKRHHGDIRMRQGSGTTERGGTERIGTGRRGTERGGNKADRLTLVRRWVLGTVAAVLVGLAAPALAQERVVNVYNWNDYIDPKVLEDFTRETGIKVVYDTYDNNEIVETKMLAGRSGYDIVVPSAPFLQRMVAAGVFQPLDRSKVPNLANLWPEITNRLKTYDPDNRHAVPYLWGTVGLGINVQKVRERLGNDFPRSWQLLLEPRNASRLKDCGIHVLDGPEDVLPNVLRAIRLDPNSKNEADLRRAGDAVFRIRDNVRKFHSSEYINALAGGDICMALGFSGDILQARKRAKEAGNGVEIEYIIPVEGAQMWFDSMVIPKDAPNAENAHIFINYMLRPEVAAANSNLVEYANANILSKPLVKPEVRDNPNVYPTPEVLARLFTNTAYDERLQRAVTRIWTRVKTGR